MGRKKSERELEYKGFKFHADQIQALKDAGDEPGTSANKVLRDILDRHFKLPKDGLKLIERLVLAGFTEQDDPQFKFAYDLKMPDQEYEGDGPALLFDMQSYRFCVTDGESIFIYFNADNPAEAVEWANQITVFEPN